MLESLTPRMTPAIVVAVLIYMHRAQRLTAAQMEARLRQDVSQIETRLSEDMERLDGRVVRLEHGQARLEGLLKGLREAITRHPVVCLMLNGIDDVRAAR